MGSGGLYFAIGHVNLIVGRKYHDIRSPIDDNVYLTIDFLPLGDTRGQHSWSIAENTVIAMYMNNRAAEALARASPTARAGERPGDVQSRRRADRPGRVAEAKVLSAKLEQTLRVIPLEGTSV